MVISGHGVMGDHIFIFFYNDQVLLVYFFLFKFLHI